MEILTVEQMYALDRAAIKGGVSRRALMEAAGQAVADVITARWEKRSVMILAGPGNNGGDGFVAARVLKAAGWKVDVYLLGDKVALKADAAANARRWRNKVFCLEDAIERLEKEEAEAQGVIVVDALFGSGLSKPLGGAVRTLGETLARARNRGVCSALVAVDMPSGVDGDTGQVVVNSSGEGIAFHADVTVTFCCPKPGHLLLPGREYCGERVVADIGIPDAVRARGDQRCHLNDPVVWRDAYPRLQFNANKYARAHVVVLGGERMTGAARLVAMGARRAGAGLLSIAVPEDSFALYACACDPGTLIIPFKDRKEFQKILSDERKSVCILGPGSGVGKSTRQAVVDALKAGKRCVLDADALTSFEKDPDVLFKAIGKNEVVLTPHGGEFARVFARKGSSLSEMGKVEAARFASARSHAVVLYKGADTVIAAPDGRVVVNANAPPTLATGGTGDVLSGMIGALLGQGMPAFEAAAAAAWLHSECATSFGPGLIAEDLCDELPQVLELLQDLLE